MASEIRPNLLRQPSRVPIQPFSLSGADLAATRHTGSGPGCPHLASEMWDNRITCPHDQRHVTHSSFLCLSGVVLAVGEEWEANSNRGHSVVPPLVSQYAASATPAIL